MDALPLDVSPVAVFLFGLAERRASGSTAVGERRLVLAAGEVCDVEPAPDDLDFGDFLVASGRLTEAQLASSRGGRTTPILDEAILALGVINKNDLKVLKRSLWLDRFVRALRTASARQEAPLTLEPSSRTEPAAMSARLVPFALDALTRLAADTDATSVGMSLNHRLHWIDGPHTEEAKRWASFGKIGDRPVVSAVLARLPAVAPQIAALARAGLVRLDGPGTPGARAKSKTGTLPPPAPRLSVIPEAAPEPVEAHAPRPSSMPRAPRLRLDPGADGIPIEAIPEVSVPRWERAPVPLHDPLREVELRIAALEERNAPGPERARAFVELARLWQTRIGSLEEAARALREAAAADPSDAHVLQEAALHCSYLGQTELAVAYAQAAVAASPISVERAAAYRLLADIHRAAGNADDTIETLSEAAAEDPSNPEPHELLAQLLADRDNLPVAVAHARMAALAYVDHEKPRAAFLYGMAYAWNPSDALLAEEYAALLDALGHAEAAVAITAETARNIEDPELRRRVRLGAARRAEASRRRDLSAELLTEVFDEDPTFELIYAPLDEDLSQPGRQSEQLAMLEAIAMACPPEQTAVWWARAGEVALSVDGEHETALSLLARALQQNPTLAHPLELLVRAGASRAQINELAGNDEALAKDLETRLSSATSERDELRLRLQLTAIYVRRGDFREVASHALKALAIEPSQPMGLARLWRATASLRDPALTRDALTLRARAKQGGREQGRALAVLARQLENMGEWDAAVASADAALASDDTAADAAIIVLRHGHRLEPSRAVALLSRARILLGELPPLLSAIADAARAASDLDTHLAVLHDYSQLMPLLPDPHLSALDHHLTQDAPNPILQEAEALLRDAGGPLVVSRVKDAVIRLQELSAYADAARLAQRVMDEGGHTETQYADYAVTLAEHADDPPLLAVALERAASTHVGEQRLAILLRLAEHHARHGDHVAELRAFLRALAVDAACPTALDGLAALFAQTGDANRLLTVLSLSLDAQTDPQARAQRLLDLAAAAAQVANDRGRAVTYVKTLMLESAEDRAGLLSSLGALFSFGDARWAIAQARSLARDLPSDAGGVLYLWIARKAETDLQDGKLAFELAAEGARSFPATGELLLMVERLTLASNDRDAALSVYGDLIAGAIGPHGQRALHYRAGRWLERSGSLDTALTHYEQAFELAKGAGVAFKAIARVARATGRLAPLVNAQEALAETLNDEAGRFTVLTEAARIALHEVDDPARGFRLLMKADELGTIGQLELELLDAAHKLGSVDKPAEEAALQELATVWEQRAEKLWDAEAKTQLLLNAAKLHLLQRNDAAASVRTLSAALVPDVSSSLPAELHATALTAMAEALASDGRADDADNALRDALALVPNHTHALALKTRLDEAKPPPSASSSPPPKPASQPPRTRHTDPPLRDAATVAAQLEPIRLPEQQLRERAELGDAAALGALTQLLTSDRTRRPEAHYLLGQWVRAEPFRLDNLRKLHAGAVAQAARAEAVVCAEILSLVDPAISTERHGAFHTGLFRGQELHSLIDVGRNPAADRLLALLWENARAIPRFRHSLDSYDVGARQRVSLNTDSPAAMAFARASRLLDRSDTPLYLKVKAHPVLTVVPTHPPAIIARADLGDAPELIYRMAQCLLWAEPQNAITCVLPEQDGRELVAGLVGAFGPPGASETLSRASKELASLLWHTVPMRTQAQMRELIGAHFAALGYDELRRTANLSAHRAGLYVLADARLALESLASLDPALRALDIHSEDGFRAACTQSEAFSEVIRTALSEAYLTLVAQVL